MSSEKGKKENTKIIEIDLRGKPKLVDSIVKEIEKSDQRKEKHVTYKEFVDEDDKKKLEKNLNLKTLSSRENTDIICLLFFFLLLFGQLGIGGYAIYMNARKLNTLGAPIDPDGNHCGVGRTREYPFIYWVNPFSQENLHRTVCVKNCLVNTRSNFLATKLKCYTNSVVKSCDFKADDMSKQAEMILYYDTIEFLGKVCLPRATLYFKNAIKVMRPPTFHIWMKDLRTSFTTIMLSFIGTIILGFVFVFFTRINTKLVVWIFIIFYLVSLVLIAVYFLYQSQNAQALNSEKFLEEETVLVANAREGILSRNWNFILSVAAFSLAVVSLALLIFFRQKISLTIEIMDTASDFIDDNQAVLFVPFISFIWIFFYFAFWILVAGCIFVGGSVTKQEASQRFPFSQYEIGTTNTILLAVHTILAVFFVSFTLNFTNYIFSTCFALWYFKFDPDIDKQVGRGSAMAEFTTQSALRRSFKSAFYSHWGSITLGSVLMIPFGIPSWCFMILRETCQSLKSRFQFFSALSSLCCCFTNLYEVLFYWITSNAYTMIGLFGKSFRQSGLHAAKIVDDNFETYSISSSLSGIFILLGNLFITSIVILVCYAFLEFLPYYENKLNSSIFPLAVIAVFSFFTAYCFMTIFATAVDSNLICYFIEQGSFEMSASVRERSSRKIKHYMEKHSPVSHGHKKSMTNFISELEVSHVVNETN